MEIEHPEEIAEEKTGSENAEAVENHAEPVPPVPETLQMPEKPHRSWFAAVLHFLFSADTAVGRFLRPLLRWTAFIVILFAAGLLVMYFWRVRPTEKILAQTAAQLVVAQDELTGAREKVAASDAEMSDMQTRVQVAEETAQTASQHLLLTTLRNDIASARVALLADKDIAQSILDISAAKTDLESLKPAIEPINTTLADELDQDLTAIQKSLNSRPINQTTIADQLFSFDVKLLGLEKLMFPGGELTTETQSSQSVQKVKKREAGSRFRLLYLLIYFFSFAYSQIILRSFAVNSSSSSFLLFSVSPW